VRRLADIVRQDCDRLDILINNAGIGSGGSAGKRETSQDGHELRFAVNYLAGFLLTRVLLPLVILGRPARIVNVSSLDQHSIDFDDVMLTRGYSGSRAYAQSKLAQIMFTFDLARELNPETVTVNCLHPATYMATTMVRQSGVTPISTVEEGAEAILSPWRTSSTDVPASSTTDCGRRRQTRRPMTTRRASDCGCLACN
jgi:NAD(P)-dependent dehydrogenase (short-subunit alcohol dehydrogenase family)